MRSDSSTFNVCEIKIVTRMNQVISLHRVRCKCRIVTHTLWNFLNIYVALKGHEAY